MRAKKLVYHTAILFITICGIQACQDSETVNDSSRSQLSSNLNDNGKTNSKRDVNGRSTDEIICQEGRYITVNANNQDFSDLFNAVCEKGTTNEFFAKLLEKAYKGVGEPEIVSLKTEIDDRNVITLVNASAVYLSGKTPMDLSKIDVHKIFADGIASGNSFINIDVEGIETFPGNKSVKETIVSYDLTNANGAGIFDRRKTAINAYALLEGYEDATITTEHLLESENNHYYAITNGLTINYKSSNGGMYLVMISELIMTNRFDPNRMIKTTEDINKGSNKIIYERLGSTN